VSSDRNAEVVVEFSGDLDHVGARVEAGLYRVAQEAVTNAIRHARRASKITVRVDGTEHDVVLTVSDDGVPVQAANAAAGDSG
jgi:signal transduction histidine kinase